MFQTFVFKLRPTRRQAAALDETLETCRRLYNRAVAERKDAWQHEQRTVVLGEQRGTLPALRRENPYLARVHSQVLQDVCLRVDRAFQAFFRRCKKGNKPGYPRFRGPGWYDSFTYPQWGNGARLMDGRLRLSKIGTLRLCADRPLQGTPKTCTVSRRIDGWYVPIACEVEPAPLPATGHVVGIDLGLEHFATLSTGEHIPNPRLQRAAKTQLRKAQRRLARRRKGSTRRRKARVLLAKAHLKVRRARLDFCHKLAAELVRHYDVLYVEALSIQSTAQTNHLARSILDAGWGLFLNILRFKAERAGRQVVEVNPAGTSQTCSGCGARVPKPLRERRHLCPECQLSLHRDHNAAIRILQVGGGTSRRALT